jgi:hypothetical protein
LGLSLGELAEDGTPVYSVETIKAYVTEQLAYGRLTADASPTHQPRAAAAPMFDGEERPHVRVHFATAGVTQSVFAIDSKAARRLAASLIKSADMLDKHLPA